MRRESVALVGLHGQTILHRPRERFTRQLCDGARASRLLGLDVVNDFRAADVAAGGEGAPFVPLYHAAICAGLERPLMVLNWGGVGNVTYLGADGEIVAFDTGPANALIDDFVGRRRGLSHDEGGALAAAGRVDAGVLARLMSDPYFDRAPPKSLDRNHFHASAREVEKLGDEDGAATLAAFTIEATAAALRHFVASAVALAGVRRRAPQSDLDARARRPARRARRADRSDRLRRRRDRGAMLRLSRAALAPRPAAFAADHHRRAAADAGRRFLAGAQSRLRERESTRVHEKGPRRSGALKWDAFGGGASQRRSGGGSGGMVKCASRERSFTRTNLHQRNIYGAIA